MDYMKHDLFYKNLRMFSKDFSITFGFCRPWENYKSL